MLLALILGITLLAGCAETETDSPGALEAFLPADEAREIAQAWLKDHPIKEPDILEREYDSLIVDGEEYYMFFPDSHEMYWFSILVHKETGELLARVKSDGESPIEEIEPLDEWYNRFFP